MIILKVALTDHFRREMLCREWWAALFPLLASGHARSHLTV